MAVAANASQSRRAWLMPAGFGLSAIGLVLATYAYTPPRAYDARFALLALTGFVLLFLGIVIAGHARAAGGRRKVGKRGHVAARPAKMPPPPPKRKEPTASETLQEKKAKSRFTFPLRRSKKDVREAAAAETLVERAVVKCPRCAASFQAEGARPLPLACPECGLVGTLGADGTARIDWASSPPLVERVALQCPRCESAFTAEGTRPIAATCPSCGLSAVVK